MNRLPVGLVESIQVGTASRLDAPWHDEPVGREIRSAICKERVAGPVLAGRHGLQGDEQADRRSHGGPDKAVLAYSADHYPAWKATLQREFPFGGFGENLTVSSLSEENVCLGDIWQIDDIQLQVSQPRQPCFKLARRWQIRELPKLVVANGRGGWYLRVLTEGHIEAGMRIEVVARPYPQWPIRRANDAMYGRLEDRGALVELASLPEVAASWKAGLA